MSKTDIVVRICTDDGQVSVVFQCPKCGQGVIFGIEPEEKESLAAAGIEQTTWTRESPESSEMHFGDPINPDDLLEFHLLMQDRDRLEGMINDLGKNAG